MSLDTDQVFASSLSKAGRVVLAIPFLNSHKSKHPPSGLAKHVQRYRLKDISGRSSEVKGWKSWFYQSLFLVLKKYTHP